MPTGVGVRHECLAVQNESLAPLLLVALSSWTECSVVQTSCRVWPAGLANGAFPPGLAVAGAFARWHRRAASRSGTIAPVGTYLMVGLSAVRGEDQSGLLVRFLACWPRRKRIGVLGMRLLGHLPVGTEVWSKCPALQLMLALTSCSVWRTYAIVFSVVCLTNFLPCLAFLGPFGG